MSMPISGSAASMQALKAQQAWEARKAASKTTIESATKTVAKTVAPPVGNQTRLANQTQSVDSGINDSATDHGSRLTRAIPEIQEIARKAGFVGVTAQDIQRAFARGESLLSDYRV